MKRRLGTELFDDPHRWNMRKLRLNTPKACLLAGLSLTASCSLDPAPEVWKGAQLYSQLKFETSEPRHLTRSTLDPLFRLQWYLENTGQISEHGVVGVANADIRFQHSDLIPEHDARVILAVIDSGIDLSHPDLDLTRLHSNAGESGVDDKGHERSSNGVDDDNNGYVDDVLGWSFSGNSNNVGDTLGHGTHVAGLLMGRHGNGLGVANRWRGFRILPIQIFSSQKPTADHATIAQAIRYAVDRGAHVISASFGSQTPSQDMRTAVEYAARNGVILVSAAGNFRANSDLEPSYPAHFGFPNQLAVGASERRDLATTFTNFGHKSIDIFAPGEDILSTSLNGGYAVRSGTSQACPLVSGAVATAKSLYFTESPEQIIERVRAGADMRTGLLPFSEEGLRLNIDNVIFGRDGFRSKKTDQSLWKSVPFSLASEHPYRSNLREHFFIRSPVAASRIRIHFRRFTTQSSDVVELRAGDGSVLISLSGALGEFWTPEIAGDSVHLHFITDRFVGDFGWVIDRLEILE